jgi:hypothetical protein
MRGVDVHEHQPSWVVLRQFLRPDFLDAQNLNDTRLRV